jgi:hypothetical protein
MAPIKIFVRFDQILGMANKKSAIRVKKSRKRPGLPNLVPVVSNPDMIICLDAISLHGK